MCCAVLQGSADEDTAGVCGGVEHERGVPSQQQCPCCPAWLPQVLAEGPQANDPQPAAGPRCHSLHHVSQLTALQQCYWTNTLSSLYSA